MSNTLPNVCLSSPRASAPRVNAINVGWTLTDNEHVLQRVEMGSENWIEEADKV